MDSSRERIDSDDIPPLILGVVGVLGVLTAGDYPALSLTEFTEFTELLLPVDKLSDSMLLSLVDKEGFFSNNLERLTLKIESVGMLGVDNSKPP